MQISPPVRPEQSIQRLMQALEPIAEKMKVVPRRRIMWKYKNKPQLYLFLQGELSILRSSDGLLIVTVYEPHLFGIAEMIQPVHGHLLRAEAESTLLRVDADKARELFHQQGLWEDAAAVLSYHTGYLFYRDDLVVQQRTYSVRDSQASLYFGLYSGSDPLIAQQCFKCCICVKKRRVY